MVPNTPQSCPLLWQPTDIIVYLSTFMNIRTKVQVKHTSSRFFKLFRDHVPVTVKINNPKAGLKFVNMFKKLSLEVTINSDRQRYHIGRLWGIGRLLAAYTPESNCEFSQANIKQLAPYITRLYITYGSNISYNILQHLHNLTHLSITGILDITNNGTGIQHMVHLKFLSLNEVVLSEYHFLKHLPNLEHLTVKNCLDIYHQSNLLVTDSQNHIDQGGLKHIIRSLVHLKHLDVGNMFDIDYDTLQPLTKLERLYVRHNTILTDDDVRRLPQLKLLSVGLDSPISVEVTKGRDLMLFKDQKLVTD